MLRRWPLVGFSFAFTPLLAWTAPQEDVTLVIPGVQCGRCVEALTGSLSRLDASIRVGEVGTETKQMPVSYDPSKVTLHQLVQEVAKTPPVHMRPYEAGVLVTIEEPAKNAPKMKRALAQVRGVVNFFPAPGSLADSGEFFITLRPLPATARPTDHVKATQIAEALEKNGIRFAGLPSDSAGAVANDSDMKKKPSSRTTGKARLGGDAIRAEKAKPVRTPPNTSPKARRARDASLPDKTKDQSAEDRPRFRILAGDSQKVFLVDYETKNDDGKELKKLVKEGDKFGDYVVKEVGDDEGLFVVLEHTETEEIVRVERDRKEKDKDKGEGKGKDGKTLKETGDSEKNRAKEDD